MTAKLQQRIDAAAEEIVTAVDDCLLRTPKLNRTKAILTKLATDLEKELTPAPAPANPAT